VFVLAGILGLVLTLGAFLTRSYRVLSDHYRLPSEDAALGELAA
jgi:hypothetical protein